MTGQNPDNRFGYRYNFRPYGAQIKRVGKPVNIRLPGMNGGYVSQVPATVECYDQTTGKVVTENGQEKLERTVYLAPSCPYLQKDGDDNPLEAVAFGGSGKIALSQCLCRLCMLQCANQYARLDIITPLNDPVIQELA